jgi:putative transcriptional regulator
MNKREFAKLMQGVREMGAHLRGESVRGARTVDVPNVKAIREAAKVSQSEFATLIGVNVRTLQNWEQQRARPTGPARALLRIVAADPHAAVKALHG